MSIEVKIPEGRAHAPVTIPNAGVGCNVREGTIPIVSIKLISAEVSKVNVGIPVVVVVCRETPHTVTVIMLESGFCCGINKCSVPFITVEDVYVLRVSVELESWSEGTAIDKIDVEMSIVIVVKKESTRSHRFR